MDPIKPAPQAPVTPPDDLSYQVMPQQGHFEPVIPPSAPQPSRPGSLPKPSLPVEPETSGLKWGYIIGGAVVLLVLGFLAYFMLGSKKSSTTQQAVNQTLATKLPKVWLQQYFAQNLDANGNCNDQSICGDTADPDNDGLQNYDEFKAGTNPTNPDTDGDGIADGDEVNIYKTDPTLKFTDRRDIVAQNNWTDGYQIKNGYDPLTPGLKFTDVRKQQIADDTTKFSLHEPTITTLNPSAPSAITPGPTNNATPPANTAAPTNPSSYTP